MMRGLKKSKVMYGNLLSRMSLVTKRTDSTSLSSEYFPISIVGSGPVGMAMSALLSNYNVKHCLIGE